EEFTYGVENLAMLDLIFAKAKYAEELQASEPILHNMKGEGSKNENTTPASFIIRLDNARHPLLNPDTVVPIDIDPKPGTRAIVITGPNTGGKTVSLKTV